MPRWHRRLVAGYEQIASDVQIWRAFRRKDRVCSVVDIASDGGLSNDAVGTYGWKIVTNHANRHDITLFQGSGFIDGPSEVGSSTRSELGGFTAPLFLATALARFWGIRHKCQFRWYTDSKTAISKVRMYTTKGKPTQYPDNPDYLMTIHELTKELRRPLLPTRVKGHQDDDRNYDELPRDARLNVDVDALATQRYNSLSSKNGPMRSIDHLPCQQISISIDGKRFPSHWDTNLRWSINGSYMKRYILSKQGWELHTWDTIDFEFVKAYCKSEKMTERIQWFKCMHNLQSIGVNKQKIKSTDVEVEIDLCPCCRLLPETQQHMFLCDTNPQWSAALEALATGGSTFKENHFFTAIMTDCIEQYRTMDL